MKFYSPILSLVEQAAQDALTEIGQETLERSNELSPTQTGETDDSGFVQVDDLTVQVGYTSFIARLQHEDLDFQHKPGEQAKFLEAAAEEVDIEGIVAAKVRERLA